MSDRTFDSTACVVAFATLPGEEVLAAGGTLARLVGEGCQAVVIDLVAEDSTFPDGARPTSATKSIVDEARRQLGINDTRELPYFLDNAGSSSGWQTALHQLLQELHPMVLLVPHPGDMRQSSEGLLSQLMVRFADGAHGPSERRLLCYPPQTEPLAPTSRTCFTFKPSVVMNIDKHAAEKRRAVECLASCAPFRFMIESTTLSQHYLSLTSTGIGFTDAEYFQLMQHVIY